MSKGLLNFDWRIQKRSSPSDIPAVNWGSNIFGSIAKAGFPIPVTKDFIPVDAAGNVLDFTGGNVDAQWLGLSTKIMQYWAYNYCSPLASVIDRMAEADTNGRIEFQDEEGHTVKNANYNPQLKRIKNLLANPNPWQTWEEFNAQQVIICKIFGYCPVFAICPVGFTKDYSKALININPAYATPRKNVNFDLFGTDGPISEWSVNIGNGKNITILARDILILRDGYVDANPNTNDGLPLSKVAGLDYWISNICAAMEADNVLLKKKGPLGVFSYDQKPDMAGVTAMTNEQKKEIQDELARYGLTWEKLQYIVTKQPLKWNAMSFNLRDLMTKETVRQGIDGICDRFAYPAELMSGKNATYENRKSAEQYLYQSNIIPFTLRRMSRFAGFFGLENYRIVLDYQHLPVMQEDIMKAGQARKALSDSIKSDWTAGLLTFNEARRLMEQDEVVGMDIYYNEYIKKYPPLAPVKPILNAA